MSFGYQVLGFGSGGGPQVLDVEYLVVAGGASGGGGKYFSGGGGAGGYRTATLTEVEKGSPLTVTVGAGGPSVDNGDQGDSGANSVSSLRWWFRWWRWW